MTGTNFVERIDSILKEKNIKRQALADAIGIDSSNFAHWKRKNYLPDVVIAYKIACFLKVSVEWLLKGDLGSEWISDDNCKLNPQDIFFRIEDRIRWLTNSHSDEAYADIENLYSFISDIADTEILISWKNSRLSIDLALLYRISEKLDVQFQWLLTGTDPRTPAIEQHVVNLAEKYASHIKFYDSLLKEDKDILDRLTEVLFKVTRDAN